MQEIFPNYYEKFKCIADRCRHSCCVGWEIDVDEDTLDFYSSLDSELGERIRNSIEGDVPHFALSEDERCPFLNKRGLCDIISELGEDGVCDICRMHPRFVNVYDGFSETGLGLCCEEAARIVLTETEKFSLELPDEAKNNAFFKERGEVLGILQDRRVGIGERLKRLAEKYGLSWELSGDELYRLYAPLERLDKSWDKELEHLREPRDITALEREDAQIFFEQLACYFVFRHFDGGMGFALIGCLVLGAICADCESIDQMLDKARMYSSEIEYSEENTQKVKDYMKDKNKYERH